MGFLEMGIGVIILLILSVFFTTLFYCWVLYKIVARIPKANLQFPIWFIWLFLIPVAALIFQWIMLPFGIPDAFKKTFAKNQEAIQSAVSLSHWGLAQMIFTTLSLFSRSPINVILATGSVICWIIYWKKIITFKNQYLMKEIQ